MNSTMMMMMIAIYNGSINFPMMVIMNTSNDRK